MPVGAPDVGHTEFRAAEPRWNDGSVDRTIELPVEQPTSCQFAGPNLDVLFITTARQRLTQAQLAQQPLAGALLAADVGVRGLPETRYRG